MTLRPRDRKLLLMIAPIALIAAYWLLLLGPKREEAGQVGKELSAAREERDDAVARAGQLGAAKARYAEDYEAVVRLGKAIPSSVGMPSLILQLDRAARGTGIDFTRIKAGGRVGAGQPSPSGGSSSASSSSSSSASGAQSGGQGSQSGGSGSQSGGSGSAPAAAPGGQAAQTSQGKAAEAAGNAANTANAASSASSKSDSDASQTDTTTSTTVRPGSVPVGGGSASGGAPGSTTGVPGLDSVPLEFKFTGGFFDLADFFHRMKRFVRVVNERILVRGRLMTIDSFRFESGAKFPRLEAEVRTTVYLTPKAEGETAGATPSGPAGALPASGAPPATSPPATSSGTPPAATVTR
jgi:Tfp pilus assembly protein PilO